MLISVITPTYNRARTLANAFSSLLQQDVDLEWIVVDDGSSDSTSDLVHKIADKAPFPVHYIPIKHIGKWQAVNQGVATAHGTMSALLDSDDILVPKALSRLAQHWHAIGDHRRYVGVTGLCLDDAGAMVGRKFPRDPTDAAWQEMVFRYRIQDEKWGIQRTDILRMYPFPAGAGYVAAVVWSQIGQRYLTRYVNDPVRIYRSSGPDQMSRQAFAENADGAIEAYAYMLNNELAWFRYAPGLFTRYAANLGRALFHRRVSVSQQAGLFHTWPARTLWATTVPLAWFLFRRDMQTPT